ncbi:MAG: hypothetical protein JO153_09440 [Solirubrobacterales bacterium]|nr:hypothetical protein [Solirubrobacterales bacterium]MBV9916712.1 hypothetical protein [Solirubrobacterales bacterium]
MRSGGSDDAAAAEESCASNSSREISVSSACPSGAAVSWFPAGCQGLARPGSDALTLIASRARAAGSAGSRCRVPFGGEPPADRGADAWICESGGLGGDPWLPELTWLDGIELGPE